MLRVKFFRKARLDWHRDRVLVIGRKIRKLQLARPPWGGEDDYPELDRLQARLDKHLSRIRDLNKES